MKSHLYRPKISYLGSQIMLHVSNTTASISAQFLQKFQNTFNSIQLFWFKIFRIFEAVLGKLCAMQNDNILEVLKIANLHIAKKTTQLELNSNWGQK